MQRSPKRFYTSQILDSESRFITLEEKESHHLRSVLRLEAGAQCLMLDANGAEWLGTVLPFEKGARVKVEVKELSRPVLSRFYHLTIAQALLRRGKMDGLVEKATELGVDVLIPMETERTVVAWRRGESEKVKARWMRIVQGARKQSGSGVVTEIVLPCSFERLLGRTSEFERVFFFDPRADVSFFDMLQVLRAQFSKDRSEPFHLAALIGPEGGFSDRECKRAKEAGCAPVRLGPHTLKSDTAFLAVASAFFLGLS